MDFSNPKAIYLQIADYILEQVITKSWPAGERIKSVRELAAQIEVNPNTVVRAYNFLHDRGIIFQKRGIGYFLSEDAVQKAFEYEHYRFTTEELPKIFETMDLLDLTIEDLHNIYKRYQNEK